MAGISLSALFDTLQRIAIASGDPRANQLIAWTSGFRRKSSEFPDFNLCPSW
ncbi:ferrichrome uptake protein fhuB [Glaesserella parasuis SW140]|nr:ferrichrome uptake protein fhuB [Glaesserella parasuis SW140]